MRISFPHMGNLYILLKDLFKRAKTDIVIPPPTTAKTLRLGVKYAPEFACLPLKVTIGNFIEALEAGADTLVMAGGVGPCRFGYYAEIQKRILEGLGYNFRMITLEPPGAGWLNFIRTCKELAPDCSLREIYRAIKISFNKARSLDMVEKRVLQTRAYEAKRGETTKAYKKAIKLLDEAFAEEEIELAREKALALVEGVQKDEGKDPLKIGIVGEFYILLEPFFNFDLEEWLGQEGVYLERGVYLTDWISPSKDNIVSGLSYEEVKKAAAPYLAHFVGGEGLPTIGHTVEYAHRGFDGVIQLFPFTCMPDTIAKSILPKLIHELDIPVLSFVIDEQTGKAGIITRLEAFLDLLEARRKRMQVAGRKMQVAGCKQKP